MPESDLKIIKNCSDDEKRALTCYEQGETCRTDN